MRWRRVGSRGTGNVRFVAADTTLDFAAIHFAEEDHRMQIVFVGYPEGPFTTASTSRLGELAELVRAPTGVPVVYGGQKLYASPAGLRRLADWCMERPVAPPLEVHRDRREKWRGQ